MAWGQFVGFFVGFVCGFCSSAPIGPINLWIVNAVCSGHSERTKSFIGGVVATDMILASVAYWGYFHFLRERAQQSAYWLSIAGGILLISLGFHTFRQVRKPGIASKTPGLSWFKPRRSASDALIGFLLTASNPGFLVFWIFVVHFLDSYFIRSPGLVGLGLFVSGVALGDGLWFTTFLRMVRAGADRWHPQLLVRLRYVVAICLIGFGGYSLVQSGLQLRSIGG